MQEVYKDSTVGKEEEFSVEKMMESLKKENVDHVKVYEKLMKSFQKNITEAQLKQRSHK